MRKPCYYIFLLVFCFLLIAFSSRAQQLKLGNNPTQINPASVLELQSYNQGLRLTRADTAAVNLVIATLTPALQDSTNGMVIFQVSDSSIYYRSGGFWQKLANVDSIGIQSLNGDKSKTQTVQLVVGTNNYASATLVDSTNGNHYLFLPYASSTYTGLVNTGTQIFGGGKTFANTLTLGQDLSTSGSSGISGQVLRSLGTGISPKWENILLDSLYNVKISSPTGGQFLQYNGTNWVNGLMDTSNISNFYLKVRNELSGTNGWLYNKTTGVGQVDSSKYSTLNFVKNYYSGTGLINVNNSNGQISFTGTQNPGTVTNVTGTAPIIVTSGSTTPNISITQAGTSSNGYLSSTDWNTFNTKWNGATNLITSPNTGDILTYNGTTWINTSGNGVFWAIKGNSGTNPATNFLGTTDAQPLVFKANGIQVGYLGIGSAGGNNNVIFGNGSSISAGSTYSIAIGNANAGATYAVAIGDGAQATGNPSTSIGYFTSASGNSSLALGNNSTAAGSSSVALGSSAKTASGFSNGVAIGTNSNSANAAAVAIGNNATANGSISTAIGYGSAASANAAFALGYSSTASGSYSSALSSSATASGSQSTALGYQSKASASNSTAIGENTYAWNPNTLILGDTINNIKVGIGLNNPQYNLEVNGSGKFDNTLNLGADLYTNGSSGTTGQVLTSNGAGVMPSWQTPISSGWLLTGNNGTNPSTNFLGTKDYQPLIIKVNNQQVGYLGVPGTSNILFGIGSTANYESVAIGNGATASQNESVALGNAATSNAYQSIAIGEANTTGQGSVVIGQGASSNSYQSIAIGVGAKTNGSQNNTLAIGTGASSIGSNSTAIGYNASAPNPNTIILGNGANVGIGTSSPLNTLTVKSATANTSGLTLSNLTSTTPATTTSVTPIGVDNAGKVVTINGPPTYYGSGGVMNVTKVWEGIITANIGSTYALNVTNVNISSAGFTNILNVQATAMLNTSNLAQHVLASIISSSTTQISFVTLQTQTLTIVGISLLGRVYNTSPNTTVFIRVEGN